jgi:aconitate hydratase
MDARSIAATAAAGGVLTAATDIDYTVTPGDYHFDAGIYEKRCYNGFGHPQPETALRLGPNITDWPKMPKLEEHLLVQLAAVIPDEVTTTDELIPSGETSSYRSNPVKLSEFALSRRVPEYVERSKTVRAMEEARRAGKDPGAAGVVMALLGAAPDKTSVGSCVLSRRPGDGSAREQAASCQKVLGGFANICYDYATKRYRSNCINWGIVPFTMSASEPFDFAPGDWVFIPGVRAGILAGQEEFDATLVSANGQRPLKLFCRGLSAEERKILTEGCLMNYYAAGYGAD